jgi:hypothetical protein
MGSRTTGVVATELYRDLVCIESDREYIELAEQRIDTVLPDNCDSSVFEVRDLKCTKRRASFAVLLENGLVQAWQNVNFRRDWTKWLLLNQMLN